MKDVYVANKQIVNGTVVGDIKITLTIMKTASVKNVIHVAEISTNHTQKVMTVVFNTDECHNNSNYNTGRIYKLNCLSSHKSFCSVHYNDSEVAKEI